MAAITLDPRPATPVRPTNVMDTFMAEWTKLRTLRSTWFTWADRY